MSCLACRREAEDGREREGHTCGHEARAAGAVVRLAGDRWYRVRIFVEGATSPVFTSHNMNRSEAERFAARKREEIAARGWSHRVEITS